MNDAQFILIVLPIVAALLLTLPAVVRWKTWFGRFVAFILSYLVVAVPLFVFFFSGFLTPDGKSECGHGWLDCFMLGKLALTPVALFATAALYAVEVLRWEGHKQKWIVQGVFSGAVISIVCLIIGFHCFVDTNSRANGLTAFMLVPLYVAIWYSLRTVQLIYTSKLGLKAYLGALLGSLPFWAASVVWTKSTYASLPENPPGCFIVTAAGRGHRKFVGPFYEIQRLGRQVQANQQLITLWQFENLWHKRAPRSHKVFRMVYNRVGPVFAARIRSPWAADLVYAAIKPVELLARSAITYWNKNAWRFNENCGRS